MLTSNLTFKPVMESQRELIHAWLVQDYIHEWIHGQGLQNTLSGLETFFQYQVEGKKINSSLTISQHWIGYEGIRPFVYFLTSNISKNTDNEYTKYCKAKGLAITLDVFIVDVKYLGKGLASTVIREFLLSEFSNVSEVFIDPEKSNARAVHVYQKVGFRIIGDFIAAWHPVPHYMMKLEMKDFERQL